MSRTWGQCLNDDAGTFATDENEAEPIAIVQQVYDLHLRPFRTQHHRPGVTGSHTRSAG